MEQQKTLIVIVAVVAMVAMFAMIYATRSDQAPSVQNDDSLQPQLSPYRKSHSRNNELCWRISTILKDGARKETESGTYDEMRVQVSNYLGGSIPIEWLRTERTSC